MRSLAIVLMVASACGDDVAHIGLPHVVSHGGHVLDELNIITFTYPDDPMADVAVGFGDVVTHSHWLDAVGREYGVFGGDQLAHYTLADNAPTSITYGGLANLIVAAATQAPGLPPTTRDGSPVLYVFYLPPQTKITDDDGNNPMCVSGLAYHAWTGTGIPYAIIPTCYPDSQIARTMFASHEIIEAGTDPFGDGFYVDPGDDRDPLQYYQPEVADLCNEVVAPFEGGYAFEASWSNAHADAWRVEPCQPVAPEHVYTMVSTDPATVIDAAPGADVHVTLTGFASGPTDDWRLFVRHGYAGNDRARNDALADSARFDDPIMNDGKTVAMTLTVPADTPPGSLLSINVWSRSTWNLVAVRTP